MSTHHKDPERPIPPAQLRTTRNLTPTQRSLLRIMRECQFGRLENLRVESGQPLFDSSTRIVRVARIGGEQSALKTSAADEFELKQAVCDLFDELVQLNDGLVLRLEFRHGLPWLLETAAVGIEKNNRRSGVEQ